MLVQPRGVRMLAFLIFSVVAILGVWLSLGSYARSETARGILATRTASAKLIAPRPGQVVELLVEDGQRVVAGQRLAVIRTEASDDAASSPIGDSLEALERQSQLNEEQRLQIRRRERSERARISATLAGLRQQRSDLERQVSIQEQVVASTRDLLDRTNGLLTNGFISRVEVERRRQAHLASQQDLARLQQQRNAISAEEAKLAADAEAADAGASGEIASARSSAEALVQQGARLRGERAYLVTAPFAGRVAALQTARGRHADSTVPLMEIVPERTQLVAHVYAPARAIGFVRPGQEVRLLYDAFPYQRFGSFRGRIVRVSTAVIDPRQLAEPLIFEEPVYRLDIAPDSEAVSAFGERQPLHTGMTLTANLILDRRSFLEWLLTPLNAVLNRSAAAS